MSRGALIVIDVQNEYFDGALPITDPAPDKSLANIGMAMDGADAAGIPIIVVQHADEEADAPIFRKGSDAWKLRPEVDQRPRTHLIEKALPGAFTGTRLPDILAADGIERVTIAGYMTHMCVDTTARQAVHLGYTAEILSDATGTLSLDNSGGKATGEELHRATLVAQGQFLSEILTTDEWLRGLPARV